MQQYVARVHQRHLRHREIAVHQHQHERDDDANPNIHGTSATPSTSGRCATSALWPRGEALSRCVLAAPVGLSCPRAYARDRLHNVQEDGQKLQNASGEYPEMEQGMHVRHLLQHVEDAPERVLCWVEKLKEKSA